MIKVTDVSKQFQDIRAVDHVSLTINEGTIFGLIGTNGAGKSTFLRLIAGIMKPDQGSIRIDGMEVYENVAAKQLFFYIPDDQYFFANSTPRDIRLFYERIYPCFDRIRFDALIKQFGLELKRKINTFSKGMKKQLSIICAVCSGTKYIFCDETFDGLDPVMRQAVKSIFAKEMAERNMTTIIASHNLRELEDICDHVGLLHQGGMLLSKDMYDMKLSVHRIQCVFREDTDISQLFDQADILTLERRGSLHIITVRGVREALLARLGQASPIYSEILPLTLEELFISETEVAGYDIKKLIY